jgi:hypothetical protein
MDTSALESAYRQILDLAEQGEFTDPDDDWGADMVLAHLTVNDDLLLAAARGVLAHEDVAYDNAGATDDSVLGAQGPRPALIDRLQTSSRQLVDVASQLTDGLDAVEIPVKIADGGEVMVEGPMPIGRLLEIHATVHLPSHLEQLQQLRS